MDLVTFKNTQAPIRERYSNDAKAALLTLRAQGTADEAAVTCRVETGRCTVDRHGDDDDRLRAALARMARLAVALF